MNNYQLVQDLYDALLIQCDDSPIHQDILKRARDYLIQDPPTDEQILNLMPQQFREDLATVSRLAAYGTDLDPGIFRVTLKTGALKFARAVLAGEGRG